MDIIKIIDNHIQISTFKLGLQIIILGLKFYNWIPILLYDKYTY